MAETNGDGGKTIIEADGFVLRGRDGNKKAVLGTDEQGEAFLAFLDSDERPRLQLRVSTLEDPTGEPFVALLDSDGIPKLQLRVSKDLPSIDMLDDHGQKRVSLLVGDIERRTLDRVETPVLFMWNEDGETGIMLGLLPGGGGPLLVLQDEKGTQRVGLSFEPVPGVRIFDKRGKTIWQAPPPKAPPKKKTRS